MRIVQTLGRPRYWFGPVTAIPLVLLLTRHKLTLISAPDQRAFRTRALISHEQNADEPKAKSSSPAHRHSASCCLACWPGSPRCSC